MSKPLKPVDRALADVSRQIETVERQLRTMGHATPAPVGASSESIPGFLRNILTPPARRSPVRTRRDLFDVPDNPLHELADVSITTSAAAQPELFSVTNTGAKLSQYLVKPPKPQLKHVQRENRNRFYVWLGLAFAAVWLIYAVVR